MAVSFLQGAIRRTLAPFSEALMAYERKAGLLPTPLPSE
jgi:hypothetical protein